MLPLQGRPVVILINYFAAGSLAEQELFELTAVKTKIRNMLFCSFIHFFVVVVQTGIFTLIQDTQIGILTTEFGAVSLHTVKLMPNVPHPQDPVQTC